MDLLLGVKLQNVHLQNFLWSAIFFGERDVLLAVPIAVCEMSVGVCFPPTVKCSPEV